MDKKNRFLTVGTQECALLCAVLGLLIAVLLLTVGFWKTLMLAVFFLIGLFIGGVKDKKGCISDLIDRWFGKRAEKVQATIIRPQTEKAAEEAEEAAEEAEEADEEEAEEADPEETDDGEDADENEETAAGEAEEAEEADESEADGEKNEQE